MILLLVAIFGLVVGSFLNVVIIRGGRGESLRGRSRCESCRSTLSVWELIPIVSFLLQRGRCRQCHAALFWQYPLVELATSLAFMGARELWRPLFSFPPFDMEKLLLLITIFAGLGATIVIFVSDLRQKIIPNGAVLVLLGSAIVIHALNPHSLLITLGVALAAAFLLASLWALSGGSAMGLGDAKLIFATSFLIGYPAALVAFLFSFWLGGAAGILLILSGAKTLRDKIPFGPFIILGSILAYFFGDYFLAKTGLTMLI